jgi:hypothetical protein
MGMLAPLALEGHSTTCACLFDLDLSSSLLTARPYRSTAHPAVAHVARASTVTPGVPPRAPPAQQVKVLQWPRLERVDALRGTPTAYRPAASTVTELVVRNFLSLTPGSSIF